MQLCLRIHLKLSFSSYEPLSLVLNLALKVQVLKVQVLKELIQSIYRRDVILVYHLLGYHLIVEPLLESLGRP